jgi:hypothetical protein
MQQEKQRYFEKERRGNLDVIQHLRKSKSE